MSGQEEKTCKYEGRRRRLNSGMKRNKINNAKALPIENSVQVLGGRGRSSQTKSSNYILLSFHLSE